jgi:hypothetical protein
MRDFNNIKIRFLILSVADISLHYNTPSDGEAFRRNTSVVEKNIGKVLE